MKNSDKIIAAFLVSMGLFSIGQANQYVKTLSAQEKGAMIEVQQVAAGMDTSVSSACAVDGGPCEGPNK